MCFGSDAPTEQTGYTNSRVDDVTSDADAESSEKSNSSNVSPATSLPNDGHPLLVVSGPLLDADSAPEDVPPYTATRSTTVLPPISDVTDECYAPTATSWSGPGVDSADVPDAITVVPPETLGQP